MHAMVSLRVAATLGLAFTITAATHAEDRGVSPAPEYVVRTVVARVRGLDPARAGDAASAQAYGKVYEGLYQYAHGVRPARLEPLLAAAMPEFSADGLTCTIRIRPGIFFSDDPCFTATGGRGRELEARDFVYSILRVADPATGSDGYWLFRGRITGLDEFRAAALKTGRADYDAPVAGLAAPDRHTLRIRLTRPWPQLVYALAMHYAFAVPREAVERYGGDVVNHPVGTGPFLLKSWRRNYRMEWVRNPRWGPGGREERGGPGGHAWLPGPDRIVQHVIGDAGTQWQMFLRGQLDLCPLSRENWEVVAAPDGTLRPEWRTRGYRLAAAPVAETYYIGFNMDDPVVGANRPLRQAMARAFDPDEWRRFYRGRVAPPQGPIPPGVEGFAPVPPAYGFNLDEARRLIGVAGYPGGVDPKTGRRLQLGLEIGDAENPEIRQSTELFCRMMERIGVVVTPSYNNRPAFFEKVSRRRAQMFRLSWVGDYPDAENFLQLFYSANASPGSNRSNFSDGNYDQMFEEMREMPPSTDRNELISRMVFKIAEESPWIFLHHGMETTMLSGKIGNYDAADYSSCKEKHWNAK